MSLGKSATPLGKVRGLGSAREGGEHWLSERVTSIALVILGLWLVASLLLLPSLDRGTLLTWLSKPVAFIPMTLFVLTAFRHGLDGMKVVVDDYVHDEGLRFATNLVLLFAAVTGVSLALYALAKIFLGAA